MNPTIRQIIHAIEEKIPLELQETWDNSGWQILMPGAADDECSGVLLCVDVTPSIIEEACEKGCNLIISHHPLIFRPLKKIIAQNRVDNSVIHAILKGISIYSCHTPVDVVQDGVSWYLAKLLGLRDVELLMPTAGGEATGLGICGVLPEPLTAKELVGRIKEELRSGAARCSGMPPEAILISKVAMGGGACGDLIPEAVAKGAQAMITSDVKHNLFIDYSDKIMVIDLGHFETEQCTKEIFYNIIKEKFPNFVPYYSKTERNPITYL